MAGPCADTYSLLCREPNLVKLIVVCSLLVASLTISGPLVLVELKSDVWGNHLAAYSALVAIGQGTVAMLFGATFGRMSDHIDRRIAMGLVGLINFAQFYGLLLVGVNETGLYVWCTFNILSGVTCMTQQGCPMIFALAHDVTPPGDRELTFGITYAGTFLGAFLATIGGVFVARYHAGDPTPVLIYVAVLSLLFFAALGSIKLHKPLEAADDDTEAPSEEDNDGSAEDNDGSNESNSTSEETCHVRDGDWDCLTIAPLKFACGLAPLRNICFTAALLCLPEIVLSDVMQQFIYESLGLLEGEGSRKQLASLLSTYPGMLAQLPFFFVAGLVAKRVGALKLLKVAIPVVALLQTVPAWIAVKPELWLVTVGGIAVSLSNVIFTPVQTVNAQIAPEGRVGEVMAAVGVSKQCASMSANLMVFFLGPALRSAGLANPLWVFFPISGVISLASIAFAARIELPVDKAHAKEANNDMTSEDPEEIDPEEIGRRSLSGNAVGLDL